VKVAFVYWLYEPDKPDEGYVGYTVNTARRLRAHKHGETPSVRKNARDLDRLEIKALLICEEKSAQTYELAVYELLKASGKVLWNILKPGNLPTDPEVVAEWTSKAGLASAAANRKNGTGCFSPENARHLASIQLAGSQKAKELGVGIHAFTKEQLSSAAKKGGRRNVELCQANGTGIFGLTEGKRRAMGKRAMATQIQNGTGLFGLTAEERLKIRTRSAELMNAKMRIEGTGYFGWTKEQFSARGRSGNHIRWHVNRGLVNPECAHCRGEEHVPH